MTGPHVIPKNTLFFAHLVLTSVSLLLMKDQLRAKGWRAGIQDIYKRGESLTGEIRPSRLKCIIRDKSYTQNI